MSSKLRGRIFKHLNYGLYLPESSRNIWEPLLACDPAALTSELEKLSALGSLWASVTLGYLSLLPGSDGARDIERARALCNGPAAKGDAYALYVLAHAHYFAGDGLKAAKAMYQASRRGFPPAHMAMSKFAWYGVGMPRRTLDLALLFSRKALRSGRPGALLWRCTLYRSGALGVVRKPLGYLLWPYAYVRLLVATWIDPCSERTFAFDFVSSVPAFRTPR
jgi:hypothetical protein